MSSFFKIQFFITIRGKKKRKEELEKEIRIQMPVNYRFQGMPASFNYTDSERIRSVILEKQTDFITVDLFKY